MKNKLPFFIVLLLFFAFQQNVKAYDFSYTYQGKTLYYDIMDSVNHYAKVVNPAIEIQGGLYSYVSGDVVIPDNVENDGMTYAIIGIDNFAFNACGITSISIPNAVTFIGSYAFFNTYIDTVVLPAFLFTIGSYAFAQCYNLTSINIPNYVTTIGFYAFQCCKMASVTIPNGVTTISYGAFAGCSELTSVIIGNGVTSIGQSAFEGCIRLDSLIIPNNVTEIGQSAFRRCYGLVYVDIPESVTTIGADAFDDCTSLTSLIIPASVTSITSSIVTGCTSLSSLVVEDGNPVYDSRDNCNAIIKTDLNLLWEGCMATVIPSTVTAIGSWAFYNCSSLNSIIIPESIVSLGMWSFADCGNLSVFCESAIPPTLAYNCFGEITIGHGTSVSFMVPCDFISAYQNAPNWSNYVDNISGFTLLDYITTFVSNDESMGTVNIGTIDCDSNIIITAVVNDGFRFLGWSDGGTDNPRTFHLTGDTNVTAIFSDTVTLYQLTVIPNDASMGSVTGGGSYPSGTEITVTATPAPGYRFDHWSDNSTLANYTFTLVSDLELVAVFMPDGNGSDTVYVPVYIHDTITVTDTLWQTQYLHDTTVVTIHDSMVINHYYHDTSFVHDYIHDTVMSYINHYVHDTTYVNNYVHDTVWMSSHVFDTTIVNIYQFDTTMVNLNIFDTTIVNNYTFDTVFISNYYYDTVRVHDTVYITQEGINGVDALNAKVYSSQGQIVVEGADGNMVTLYDVIGRTLISKQDEYTPLRFDAPASGTYMIKIGNHPARKVVVIR